MILKVLNPLKHRKCQERPTSPCRLKLPTSPHRLKLREAMSGKPGSGRSAERLEGSRFLRWQVYQRAADGSRELPSVRVSSL
jgi:hypothetical protein